MDNDRAILDRDVLDHFQWLRKLGLYETLYILYSRYHIHIFDADAMDDIFSDKMKNGYR